LVGARHAQDRLDIIERRHALFPEFARAPASRRLDDRRFAWLVCVHIIERHNSSAAAH